MRAFLFWHRRSRAAAIVAAGLFLGVLLMKFYWTLWVFDVPLGYDTGIYRYLFLRHAEGFPPFSLGPMDGWAREQPLGLFVITSPLVWLGVPIDSLVGWIWNAVPVLLSAMLAWLWYRREGRAIGVLILLVSVLSLAQFYGFLGMYWKTLASLFWTILAFDAFEKKKWTMIPWIALGVATHHQTGLVLLLAVVSALIVLLVRKRRSFARQEWALIGVVFTACCIGLVFYLPQWNESVRPLIVRLLQSVGGVATPGSFPDFSFFLLVSGALWFFGSVGFAVSWKKEQGTVWQWAVLWTLVPVVLRTLFANRFLLHLDFFLLPFAALGLRFLWTLWSSVAARLFLIIAVCLQAALVVILLLPNGAGCRTFSALCTALQPPTVTSLTQVSVLRELQSANAAIDDAYILVLDPENAPWVRGWMTKPIVGGPGVLASPWDLHGWEAFILGTNADRRELIEAIPYDVYLYVSPLFRSHYGEYADAVLADPCVQSTAFPSFFQYSCVPTAQGIH